MRSSRRRIGIPLIMLILILQADKRLLISFVLWITVVCSTRPALIQPTELDAAAFARYFTLFICCAGVAAAEKEIYERTERGKTGADDSDV